MRLHGIATIVVVLIGCVSTKPLGAQGFLARSAKRVPAAPVVSQNFVVHAADPVLARKVSDEAERFRKVLAIEWLGKELPDWNQKCPITVELGMHAGGETSFAFVMDESGRGQPLDWQMKIYGPHDRILDAVLPHEVTHTIFASHFGRPLPRWADEGACTTVEHESERKKNHAMLMEFLHSQPSRGLPFNRMFTMRDYPHDILPLYAQGYSVAKFLILQKGKRYFLDYISTGLRNESRGQELRAWNQATSEFYNYRNLSDLQIAWLDWVRKGSSELAFNKPNSTSNAIARAAVPRAQPDNQVQVKTSDASRWTELEPNTSASQVTFASNPNGGWYAQQMQQGGRVATNRQDLAPTKVRKVVGSDRHFGPDYADSRLPVEFTPGKDTIWR